MIAKDAEVRKYRLHLESMMTANSLEIFVIFHFLLEIINFFIRQSSCAGIYNVASTGCYKIDELLKIFGQSENVKYFSAETKRIHNCVETSRLLDELRINGGKESLITKLEERGATLTSSIFS